jgi:ATP-dependent Lon protease
MFALSIPDPDSPIRQPAQVAGLGLVRACVQNDDGTSNLILQGVARVRFPSFSRSTPLFEGQPIPLVTTGLESPKVKSLADEIVSHILGLARTGFTLPEGVEDLLKNLDNPDMLADIVAGTFLRDPQRKQELLETDHAEKRLALLAKTLKEELPHPKAM